MPKCSSRLNVDNDGNCFEISSHKVHENHELIFEDMNTKNKFLDAVIVVNHHLENLPANVSNHDIFTRELAK